MTIAAAQAATAAAAPVAEREWAAESETPPGVLSDVTARDDFTNLLVLLRYARQGCWAFALYNNTAVREQVVAALTKLLAPLPVYQWTYSPHDPYPYAYLERMPEAARAQRAVVFLFDFERAGEAIWKALDYNRELFSAHPHGLVFWVTPPGRGRAARQAPHFWAQRSGVFDFTVDRPPPLDQVRPLAGQDISIDNLDEIQRQLRLYMGLLEDLAGQPDAPTRFLADLHLKVARLAYYVDQVPLARQHAQAALDIASDLGDARLRADSIKALGDVHVMLSEYPAARARYEEALPLYRAIGDRLGEANCIKALGDVHVRLAEYPAARARYEEALPLYRAIGDRLGEANCIKALGDVHVMLAEYPAARARYEEALPLYRAIGDRLGEANCIKALGDVHVMLAEYPAARARYEAALPLYRAIGARLGEANCILRLGDVHVRLAEYPAARARYEEALPLYRAIGDRLGEANCIQALGDVHVMLAEYPAARARYEEALPLYRAIGDRLGEANCIQALGDVHVQLSEYPAARARYEAALPLYRAISDRLGEANCIQALGDVHVQLSEYPAARARYEAALPLYRAISDRLGEANCIRALGDVSLEQGDEDAALAAYQEAFERFMALGLPNDAASVLTSQTGIYDRRKEYDRSLPLHSQAIDLAPATPMWYRNRALCYINLKDAAHALADLETAARLQPDHPYLALRRGDVALLQKDYVAAAGHYQAFIAALPRNNAGHFGLARALFGQRRPEHALAALQQALALTYSRQDVVKAIDELVELQTDSPDLPGINQGVALLRDWLAQREP